MPRNLEFIGINETYLKSDLLKKLGFQNYTERMKDKRFFKPESLMQIKTLFQKPNSKKINAQENSKFLCCLYD